MKHRLLLAFVVAAFGATVSFAAPASDRPVLEKGMSAEAIRQVAGTPVEVVPMDTPEGKAEKWIYRRKLSQTASMETAIQVQTGANWGNTTARQMPVSDYRLKYTISTQVTALLVVDGKLVLGRQWVEQTQSHAQ